MPHVPAGARVIDAAGQTLLPGLFDLHTHLSASAVTGLSGDWGKSLKAYLACGVTTVNDYATYGEMFAPLRQLLASGAVIGPRVNMAVRMSTPGGHGTEAGWGDFMTLTAATPEQAHAKTKIALSYKPDVIKVFTDGWRYGMAPNLSSMNLETLAAIVEDAHAAGVKVFTHTVTLAGAKLAACAGVDVLAHGIGDADVDAELIAIMKAKGTFYVPTLAVYEFKGGAAPAARLWHRCWNPRRARPCGARPSAARSAARTQAPLAAPHGQREAPARCRDPGCGRHRRRNAGHLSRLLDAARAGIAGAIGFDAAGGDRRRHGRERARAGGGRAARHHRRRQTGRPRPGGRASR